MEVQRTILQDSRETRDKERGRFLQDVSEERVRLAQERSAAWAEVDRAHAAVIESQHKISDLEARAEAVLRDTARVRAEKNGLEAHMARISEDHERFLPTAARHFFAWSYALRSWNDAGDNACRQLHEMAQQRAQLDKDRAMLLADAQSLHDSTHELCSLRNALVEEKDSLATGLQQLQALRQQTSLEQAAVSQQTAAVADAEGKLHELQVQISEKQATLSEQSIKV
jgi:chromosome segregation ATPase